MQLCVLPSGIQIAGTKWSTRPLFGLTSFSSGEYGNACNVRRRWLVEDDDVSVEFGCMTFSDTSSELFAFLMARHHSSRSASVAIPGEYHENARA